MKREFAFVVSSTCPMTVFLFSLIYVYIFIIIYNVICFLIGLEKLFIDQIMHFVLCWFFVLTSC